MKRVIMTLGLAAAVGAPLAVYAATQKEQTPRVCTLTDQQVDPCCCVKNDGKLVCTLTGQTSVSN